MSYIYVYLHMPKTGGQSLRDNFAKEMGLNNFIYTGESSTPGDGTGRSGKLKNTLRIIMGHGVNHHTHECVGNRPVRHITFLRSPIERMVSHYNYDMWHHYINKGKKQISLDDWFKERHYPNYMVNYIYGRFIMGPDIDNEKKKFDIVMKKLETFWFVGIYEAFDVISVAMARHFHIRYRNLHKNKTSDYSNKVDILKLNGYIIEQYNHLFQYDYELYEYWKNQLSFSIKRLGEK